MDRSESVDPISKRVGFNLSVENGDTFYENLLKNVTSKCLN